MHIEVMTTINAPRGIVRARATDVERAVAAERDSQAAQMV